MKSGHPYEQGYGENLTVSLLSSRLARELQVHGGLWCLATGSCGIESYAEWLRSGFSVFETFGDNTEGKRLYLGSCILW